MLSALLQHINLDLRVLESFEVGLCSLQHAAKLPHQLREPLILPAFFVFLAVQHFESLDQELTVVLIVEVLDFVFEIGQYIAQLCHRLPAPNIRQHEKDYVLEHVATPNASGPRQVIAGVLPIVAGLACEVNIQRPLTFLLDEAVLQEMKFLCHARVLGYDVLE